MPLQDAYPNLPGLVAQINDNGLKVAQPPQALSQSVLLLGCAVDGPSNTPIAIGPVTDAERIFGATPKPTTITQITASQKALTARVYELFASGCSDIRLVRVGGVSASITLADTVVANDLILTANYPGAKYGNGTAGLSVVVTNTAGAGNVTITTLDGVPHAFAFTTSTTYGDLMNAINASPINVGASQGATGSPTAIANPTAATSAFFSGGADGATPTDAQYSDALTVAYKQLENYPVNVVVPAGAYLQPTLGLDNSGSPTVANANAGDTVSFGRNLGQFVARMSVNTQSCIGIISVTPLLAPTFTANVNRNKTLIGTFDGSGNQVTAPTAYTFQYGADYSPAAGPQSTPVLQNGSVFDTGFLLSVCVGEIVVNSNPLGNYVADLAPSYAGRVVSLAPQSGTTNKPLNNALALSTVNGPAVLNALVGLRFVTAFTNQRDGVVRIVADNTYSAPGRDFKFLSTLRITYAAVERVRNATSGFIGEPANPATLNSMGTAIEGALKEMKTAGALIDYEYHLVATAQDQINGNMNVILGLVPALQIRKIYVTVSLKPASAINQ